MIVILIFLTVHFWEINIEPRLIGFFKDYEETDWHLTFVLLRVPCVLVVQTTPSQFI